MKATRLIEIGKPLELGRGGSPNRPQTAEARAIEVNRPYLRWFDHDWAKP